jgi:hypothetical protein
MLKKEYPDKKSGGRYVDVQAYVVTKEIEDSIPNSNILLTITLYDTILSSVP